MPKGFAGALRDLQLASFPYAGSITPGQKSPQKVVVEEGIMIPDYAQDGMVRYMCRVWMYMYGVYLRVYENGSSLVVSPIHLLTCTHNNKNAAEKQVHHVAMDD